MLNITIGAEQLFTIWKLPVTNTLLSSWIVAVLLIIISQIITRKQHLVPSFFQNVVETAVEALLWFYGKSSRIS